MKERIESALQQIVHERVPEGNLREAMLYSLLAGGKRLRPLLFLKHKEVMSELGPLDWRFAASIEMIHTYSLVHDDLPAMDNDSLRRGKPTNHVVFGEAIAILAGDALLHTAFEEMISICTIDPSYLQPTKIVIHASGASGMIFGQVLDIEGENNSLNEDEIKTIDYYKTAKLFHAAILSAGNSSKATVEQMKELENLATSFGLAFQLKDDLLDIEGDSSLVGKTLRKDMEQGKQTIISSLGLKEAKGIYSDLEEEIMSSLDRLNAPSLKSFYKTLLERKS